MPINLELSKDLEAAVDKAHKVATDVFRPISRKYDIAEHEYPSELDAFGADPVAKELLYPDSSVEAVLNILELCWGDLGLTLTIPGNGLGNAAIAAVATPEQLEKFGGEWAAMAITEPEAGSDSAAIKTTATLDGDEYVINGEKIFATAGARAKNIVVWATVDKSLGRAAIKSFVVPRDTPGVNLVRVEHKLGIKASDTAAILFENVRVPKENLLGSPEVNVEKGFAGVMQTFDNTRPIVAAQALGVARAALEQLREILEKEGVEISYDKGAYNQQSAAADYLALEADWEAAYLLTLKSAWLIDTKKPNSKEASIAKAKAGRTATAVTLKAVELAGLYGYSQQALLEKWARDAKITDIYEGTQQIQQLIIARRTLNLTSAQLK
jgi:acyl-CoA dehydrogenase